MRRVLLGVAIVMLAGCDHLPFSDDDATTVPATAIPTLPVPTTTLRPERSRRPDPLPPRARAQVSRVRSEVQCADVRRLKRRHPRWTPARITQELVGDVVRRPAALTPAARRALRRIVDECWRRLDRGD
jgi:hypothetical protein